MTKMINYKKFIVYRSKPCIRLQKNLCKVYIYSLLEVMYCVKIQCSYIKRHLKVPTTY